MRLNAGKLVIQLYTPLHHMPFLSVPASSLCKMFQPEQADVHCRPRFSPGLVFDMSRAGVAMSFLEDIHPNIKSFKLAAA